MPRFIDPVIKYYQQIKDFLLLLLDKILHQPIETHQLWENLTFALKIFTHYVYKFEHKTVCLLYFLKAAGSLISVSKAVYK